MHYEQLKKAVGGGLLCFPVTHFDAELAFDRRAHQSHVDWLLGHGPAALFSAGGTGEFFSLTIDEVAAVVGAAAEVAAGQLPVIAGCGYGTATAVEFARTAQSAGANGLLLLPPYLMQAEQEGLAHHVRTVCDSVDIGVIVYNRDNGVLQPDTLARLADVCPNLIGFKDGYGDIELLTRIRVRLADRLVYVGGMPTAEVFALPYQAIGVSTYSSAVFNFVPRMAKTFYESVHGDDQSVARRLLRDFFMPYLDIRNRRRGYAVSIVKAGLRAVGRDPGPVRTPLVDLTKEEQDALARLIEAAQ